MKIPHYLGSVGAGPVPALAVKRMPRYQRLQCKGAHGWRPYRASSSGVESRRIMETLWSLCLCGEFCFAGFTTKSLLKGSCMYGSAIRALLVSLFLTHSVYAEVVRVEIQTRNDLIG